MSRRNSRLPAVAEIGEIVYKDGSSSRYSGKIVRIVGEREIVRYWGVERYKEVEVKWLNGKYTIENILILWDSQADVDTWKKTFLEAHKALEAARRLDNP